MAAGLSYDKLDETEIRLLTIVGPSKFVLKQANLSENPEYVALSHVWVKEPLSACVQANEELVRIQPSVCCMLRTLYDHHGARTVWIDVICINQEDVDERAQQVALMHRIYTSAKMVLAWLGEGDKDSDLILDVLQRFRDLKKESAREYDWPDEATEHAYYVELFRLIYESTSGTRPPPVPVTCDLFIEEVTWLYPIYSRTYWRRVWIVQEAILNRSLIICCGRKSVEMDHIFGLSPDFGPFEQGFDLGVLRHRPGPWQGWISMQTISGHRKRLFHTAQERWESGHWVAVQQQPDELLPTLKEIVEVYVQGHQCTDMKDKVYGFCALSGEWRSLDVDYKQCVLEVFRSAVKAKCFSEPASGIPLAFQLFSAMKLERRENFDQLVPYLYQHDLWMALDL